MSAHATEQQKSPIFGLMAEFPDPTSLVLATRKTHEEGYRRWMPTRRFRSTS